LTAGGVREDVVGGLGSGEGLAAVGPAADADDPLQLAAEHAAVGFVPAGPRVRCPVRVPMCSRPETDGGVEGLGGERQAGHVADEKPSRS